MPSYYSADERYPHRPEKSGQYKGERYDDHASSRTYGRGYADEGQSQRHRHNNDDRALTHRHSSSSGSSSLYSLSGETSRELQSVLASAAAAAAIEAFRLRHSSAKWVGEKGARVATAAIGAAVADAAVEKNNDSGKHTKRHVVESAVIGLLADRLINGKRPE